MMNRIKPLLALFALSLMLFTAVRVARADTTHVIQPGDSLSRIALQYGVTIDAIVQANNIVNPNLIVAGQSLIIPGVDGPAGGQTTPAATPVPTTPGDSTTAPPAGSGTAVDGGVLHTVQPGESLSRISLMYNVPIASIVSANNLTNPSLIFAGQDLLIPGATVPAGGATTPPTTGAAPGTTPPTSPAAPAPTAVPAPVSSNLFTNGSFEGEWYYHVYNELQIPEGWQIAIDEGPNTLDPGDGGNFARPEVRVITRGQLSEAEWDTFIFDGFKVVKAFKGYAPTIFHFFQDVNLQPGRYRMTVQYFPDIVAQYFPGGNREFVTDPLSGEVRIIHNSGGTDWATVTPGQRNARTYEFTVSQPGNVRLGASFRNRFGPANNGWFLDDWKLERIGN